MKRRLVILMSLLPCSPATLLIFLWKRGTNPPPNSFHQYYFKCYLKQSSKYTHFWSKKQKRILPHNTEVILIYKLKILLMICLIQAELLTFYERSQSKMTHTQFPKTLLSLIIHYKNFKRLNISSQVWLQMQFIDRTKWLLISSVVTHVCIRA